MNPETLLRLMREALRRAHERELASAVRADAWGALAVAALSAAIEATP